MSDLVKFINFYGRFLVPFSAIGYRLHGLGKAGQHDGLAGKTILVTGATGGIGRAVALLAAEQGARVIAVGRKVDTLAALAAEAGTARGEILATRCDLGLAGETRTLVRHMQEGGHRIDAIVNNVGILNHAYAETAEGVDTMYAVNILNPYIMTEGLMEAGCLADDAVIVNMASGGLYNAPQNLTFMEQAADGYNGFAAYATHKRAQIVLSDHWSAERPPLRAYTMHPGWVETEGVRQSLPRFYKVLRSVLRTPAQGADTALWLIAERPEPEAGALWFDRKPRSAHAYKRTRTPLASDADILDKLKQDANARKETA